MFVTMQYFWSSIFFIKLAKNCEYIVLFLIDYGLHTVNCLWNIRLTTVHFDTFGLPWGHLSIFLKF